ncbi:10134_t:CDS:2 [Funneliformis geosporum]|uniref:10134_t:CDS:1 n=1 Tax=Funneliformis geosporum TaxID=1117311 RepID=A0A9W4WSS9_9GLOM|nr:10134_t:CDS:2 [Funneliformis geosporum]
MGWSTRHQINERVCQSLPRTLKDIFVHLAGKIDFEEHEKAEHNWLCSRKCGVDEDVLVEIIHAKSLILQTMKIVNDLDNNNNVSRWKQQMKSNSKPKKRKDKEVKTGIQKREKGKSRHNPPGSDRSNATSNSGPNLYKLITELLNFATNLFAKLAGGGQSQGDKSGAGTVTKTDSPKVKTHTGKTIRTQEMKQKVVFKTVLDSPFNISWPDVSIKDQNEILDALYEADLPPQFYSHLPQCAV